MLFESLASFASGNLILFFIISAAATALWGDATLIAFIVFSMAFGLPLWLTFLACYIGTLMGDTIWFFIGQRVRKHTEKVPRWEKGFAKIAYYFDKLFGKNVILTLSVVKMLYGTRVITIFYLAKEKISFRKFMISNLIATAVWLAVIGAFAVLIGLGFEYARNVLENLQLAIALVIILIIGFDLVQRLVNKRLDKNIKSSKK